MIQSIRFVDVFEAGRMRPASTAAVVSMLAADDEAHRPSFAGFEPDQVLSLQFSDIVYILSDEHALNAFNAEHARQIDAFVRFKHALREPIDLLFHCFAGISRSSAAAIYAGEITGVPVQQKAIWPNERLLALLRACDGRPQDLPTQSWAHSDSFIGAQRQWPVI